jgi:hypothetical protein
MAIRTRIIVNGEPLRNEINAMNALDEMMTEGAEKTRKQIEPHWIEEAGHYPPPAVLPFAFATEKSRRYYFAVIVGKNKGKGRYVRTNRLKQSFFMKLLNTQRGVEFILGSDTDIAKWVVDSFDKRRRYQVPGHAITGWQRIADTAAFWLDAAEEQFLKEMPTIYANFKVKRQNR